MSRFITRNIESYVLYYIGQNYHGHDAEIDLFDKDYRRVGILYFYRSRKPLQEDAMTVNGVYLHFDMTELKDILHILQTEKPLTMWWDSTYETGYISTGTEPVGEEESSKR